MAGMRKSDKKKVLKKKDGERNLHIPSCTPDVQLALRETRRAEWNKWMKFNAGIVLTDEEVVRLIEAGREIYLMKWVDTDKNAHLRRDTDCVSVHMQSTRFDCLVVEISRRQTDSAQLLQLAMWIRTISFAFGAHRPMSPFTHAISRTDTSKGKNLVEPCCTVFQLKVLQTKELQAERF